MGLGFRGYKQLGVSAPFQWRLVPVIGMGFLREQLQNTNNYQNEFWYVDSKVPTFNKGKYNVREIIEITFPAALSDRYVIYRK